MQNSAARKQPKTNVQRPRVSIIATRSVGYHVESSKCYLVVAPQFLEEAKELFSSYGVEIVTGRKVLGGFIGKREDIESWLQKKVEQWYTCVQRLAHAAKSFPHEAYTALSKSLQNEWDTYFE